MEGRGCQTQGKDVAVTMTIMAQVLTPRRSLAAAAPLTEAEIKKQQWRKQIAEISKHLSTEPIQTDELTIEQKEWLYFMMGRPFLKPYEPFAPIEIPYRWQEDTKT